MQRLWVAREVSQRVVGEIVEDHHAAGLSFDFKVKLREDRAATVFDGIEIHQGGHDPLTTLIGALATLLRVHVVGVEVRLVLLGRAVMHDLQRFGVPDRNVNEVADPIDKAVDDGGLVVLDPRNTTRPTVARRCIADGTDQRSIKPVGCQTDDVMALSLADEIFDHLDQRVARDFSTQVIRVTQPQADDLQSRDAAIYRDHGASRVGAGAARQEDHGPGDVLRRTNPLARVRAVDELGALFVFEHVGHHL